MITSKKSFLKVFDLLFMAKSIPTINYPGKSSLSKYLIRYNFNPSFSLKLFLNKWRRRLNFMTIQKTSLLNSDQFLIIIEEKSQIFLYLIKSRQKLKNCTKRNKNQIWNSEGCSKSIANLIELKIRMKKVCFLFQKYTISLLSKYKKRLMSI